MSFHWFTPEQRKFEEDAIFLLAEQIRLPKGDSAPDTWENLINPLLKSGGVHSNRKDNLISFGLLGGFLHPEFGSGSHMPQTTLPWLALRRLFLEVSRRQIPKNLRSWESAIWKSDFEPHLDQIRRITELRLRSYEGVSLASMRRTFIENGQTHTDSACGALFDFRDKLLFNLFPDSKTPPKGRNTTTLLRKVAEEAIPDFDFDSEYLKTVDSVRGVIFDLLLEAIFGKLPEDSTTPWELESMSFERLLVENPCQIIRNEKLILYLAERMEHEGSAFLGRLSRLFDTAERGDFRFNARPLKVALCQYWLHPNFPLWLMEPGAINVILLKKFSREKTNLTERITIVRNGRDPEGSTPLRSSPEKLIRSIKLDPFSETYRGMKFSSDLANSLSLPDLEAHVSELSISDLLLESTW